MRRQKILTLREAEIPGWGPGLLGLEKEPRGTDSAGLSRQRWFKRWRQTLCARQRDIKSWRAEGNKSHRETEAARLRDRERTQAARLRDREGDRQTALRRARDQG